MSKFKISLYSLYFCIIYFLVLFFLVIDVNKYGFVVHLVSLGTLILVVLKLLKSQQKSVIELLNTYNKYIFAFIIFVALQLLFIPLPDILRLVYLLVMYLSLFYLFHDRSIKTDVFLYWLLIGGALSFILNSMGLVPPLDICCSPFRVIPIPSQGWKVNFGPPGSNGHFSAIISGLGMIVGYHSILNYGQTLKRWFMLAIMTYFCIFSGSRAVYIGAFAALIIISFSYYISKSSSSKVKLVLFSWSILIAGLAVVYSASHIAPFIKTYLTNGALVNLTKANLVDPSAGRVALWEMHLSTFLHKPFGGSGDLLRQFNLFHGKDIINTIYRATNESYFTYLLAVYGVWSFVIFYLYASLFTRLCRSGENLKAGLLAFALITTAASSLFSNAYGMGIWLIVPLLAAKLEPV